MLARWQESERILSILRPIKPVPDEITLEAMERWYAEAEKYPSPLNKEPFVSDNLCPPRIDTPSDWFRSRFPRQVKIFGPAFVEESDGRVCHPILLNADTIGACLSGERVLGHQVVFCPLEGQWYYYDPVVEAFCQTTTAKLQILASNYLVQCAQSFSSKITILPLMTEFRQPNNLQLITNKAKAILQADKCFFHGASGRVRIIDGYRNNPADEPGHRRFVQELIQPLLGSLLPMSVVHLRYVDFCNKRHFPVLTPAEFKKSILAVIEEFHGLRLRHDVPGDNGKECHGWIGLSCLPV